jgi:3-deoxy-D-manno-octulosonate 8-phosphate phosphatase (KDO 8-P phosphatase)
MPKKSSAQARATKIKLLLFDVDGVLTDGKLFLFPVPGSQSGGPASGPIVVEAKGFHAQDGAGISIARIAGIKAGLITRRNSETVALRARDLKLEQVHQGIRDKLKAFREILSAEGLSASEVAFVGDDVIDLPVMRNCGFSGGQGRSSLRYFSRRRRWGAAGRDRIYSEGAGKMETSRGKVHQGQHLAQTSRRSYSTDCVVG